MGGANYIDVGDVVRRGTGEVSACQPNVVRRNSLPKGRDDQERWPRRRRRLRDVVQDWNISKNLRTLARKDYIYIYLVI